MNTIREIQKINDEELARGIAGTSASWHSQYAQSAWVYVGNLDHVLSEGDVLCVLSQYGEIEDFHLVRDETTKTTAKTTTTTGKSKGFAFCKYEDARSCILAVDNFCGIQVRWLVWRGLVWQVQNLFHVFPLYLRMYPLTPVFVLCYFALLGFVLCSTHS